MFKFARYFFFVFLVTTVIPLVLMFLWTHRQMDNIRLERDQHLLNVGINQLKITVNNYLKIRESYILEKIQDLSPENISLYQLKSIFKSDKMQIIYKNKINRVTSYYEAIKTNSSGKYELYSIFVIPFKNSQIKGIKVTEKVNFAKLFPSGPFNIEMYYGDQINQNSLMAIAKDMFMPRHPHPAPIMGIHLLMRSPERPDDLIGIPKNPNIQYAMVKIADNKGKTVTTFLIKTGKPPRQFDHKVPMENEFGLIILLAGSMLSLLTGLYIVRNFIEPLVVLSDASKQVQKGNLSFELDTSIKQDQILNTFNNFNQMVKGLKEKEELRKSFITSLTHDLRTPLIAQARSLTFIAKKFENLGLQDDYELARSLEKNNKHLLRMVNLILESYRFDSESLQLIISNINISELINDCYEKLKPLAAEKNIQFANNIPVDFPLINGDITSFKRIFLNLISNAIENIAQNDKITVSAESCGNFAKISVEDNGPGIAEEDLKHIFDRYYTGKSFERKLGAGLGLYVCKKLTEMHKGEITVESEIDNYSRFIVKLPFNI